MKFEIKRTSDSTGSECPYPGAEPLKYTIGTLEYTAWIIDADTLEELMDIMTKTNESLVLISEEKNTKALRLPIIEIYDDWRE